MSIIPLLLALPLFVWGCSHEIKGPIPFPDRLEPGGECGDEQPQLVCNEQLVTPISLCGEGFSPLVVDTLTEEDQVVLPELTLQRVSDVTGNPAGGSPVTLDSSNVTWASQEGMVKRPQREGGVTADEMNRRAKWCVETSLMLMRDNRWSSERVCDTLPNALIEYLDTGEFTPSPHRSWVQKEAEA